MRSRAHKAALLAPLVLFACTASASPNVPLDDPVYLRLSQLQALGLIGNYRDGFMPLTELQAQSLLLAGGDRPSPHLDVGDPHEFWVVPARRLSARLSLSDENVIPYSTATRPEQLTGNVAVSCEYEEGRPCGPGAGLIVDVDSTGGYGRHFAFATRLRSVFGSDSYSPRGIWDRFFLQFEWGPFGVEVGRDSFVLGPGARAHMLWGTQAAPLDQVRLSALRLALPHVSERYLRLGVIYILGRLRDPQVFEGTLVDIARLQITLFERLQLSISNVLQFGGDGATNLGFGDWIVEHFTRHIVGKLNQDSSNRRIAFDASYTIRPLLGMRLYYEVAFEDWRKDFGDALLFDADHLAGLELPVLDRQGHHGIVLEYQHIGVRSQTHGYWTTGLTNAGFTVGTPLGPDSWSLYGGLRIDLPKAYLLPAFELVRRSSDHYQFVDYGPISRISGGVEETRIRAFGQTQLQLLRDLRLDARAFVEHIDNFGFVNGANRTGLGVDVSVTWNATRVK